MVAGADPSFYSGFGGESRGEFPFLGGCGCSFKQAVAAQAWLVQGLDAHTEVAQGGRCCQELPSKL